MSFQHPVFGAEVAVAETAVADDALGSFLALLEIATRLARSHAGWLWREEAEEGRVRIRRRRRSRDSVRRRRCRLSGRLVKVLSRVMWKENRSTMLQMSEVADRRDRNVEELRVTW